MKYYYIPLDILTDFEKNSGVISITEEALQCLLDKAYDSGFSDGRRICEEELKMTCKDDFDEMYTHHTW